MLCEVFTISQELHFVLSNSGAIEDGELSLDDQDGGQVASLQPHGKDAAAAKKHWKERALAAIELGRKFKISKPLSEKKILEFIHGKLKKSSNFKVLGYKPGQLYLQGTITEEFLARCVKFRVAIRVKSEAERIRIIVSGKSEPNWWFWLWFIVGLLFWIVGAIVIVVIYYLQHNRPRDVLESILQTAEAEFGD